MRSCTLFLENATVRGRDWCKLLDAPVLTLDVTVELTVSLMILDEVPLLFITLSDTKVYEPQIRALLDEVLLPT